MAIPGSNLKQTQHWGLNPGTTDRPSFLRGQTRLVTRIFEAPFLRGVVRVLRFPMWRWYPSIPGLLHTWPNKGDTTIVLEVEYGQHIYIYIWQPIYVVNTGRLHGFDFEIYMKQLLLYIYVHTNSYAIFYQFVLCVLQENPRSKCSHMAEWI